MKQVVFTRVNFLTENSTERENIPYLMDINMKVIGKKEKLKVLVKPNTPMDLFMKVHL